MCRYFVHVISVEIMARQTGRPLSGFCQICVGHVNRIIHDLYGAVTVLTIIHLNDSHPSAGMFSVAVHTSVDANGLSFCGEPQFFKPRDRMAIVRAFMARLAGRIVHFRVANCHPVVRVQGNCCSSIVGQLLAQGTGRLFVA